MSHRLKMGGQALVCCLGLVLGLAQPASGQKDRYNFYYYHGNPKQSGFVSSNAGSYQRIDQTQIRKSLRVGTEVCLNIVNAHPGHYVYSLVAVQDTAQPVLPSLPPSFALLTNLLDRQKAEAIPGGSSPPPTPSEAVSALIGSLDILNVDLDSAVKILKRSDTPEAPAEVQRTSPAPMAGYRYGKAALGALSTDDFHFNDPSLATHFDSAVKATRARIKDEKDPKTLKALSTMVEALSRYAEQLRTRRDALAQFVKPDELVELCSAIGKGVTTISVGIKPVPGALQTTRDISGGSRAEIVIRIQNDRPTFEVNPIALFAIGGDVPRFAVENGVVTDPQETGTALRIGSIAQINVAQFGPDRSLAVGLGLGVGVSDEDQIIQDLFFATVVSYKDFARIGLGVGVSRFPLRLKKGAVGQPLPADIKDVTEIVETGYKRAFQLLFVLPGLKIN